MADNTKQWSDYWVFAYLLYPDLTYQVTDRWSLDKTPTSGRELFMKYITNKKIDQKTYDGMPKAYKEAFVKDAQTGNYTLTTNNTALRRLEQNVQNNAANYTDDILKTNLPALYARTNREDAVTNVAITMGNSANDMEKVIGSGKIIPEAYEPDLSLSINGGPTGPSFTASTNTSTQQQTTNTTVDLSNSYPTGVHPDTPEPLTKEEFAKQYPVPKQGLDAEYKTYAANFREYMLTRVATYNPETQSYDYMEPAPWLAQEKNDFHRFLGKDEQGNPTVRYDSNVAARPVENPADFLKTSTGEPNANISDMKSPQQETADGWWITPDQLNNIIYDAAHGIFNDEYDNLPKQQQQPSTIPPKVSDPATARHHSRMSTPPLGRQQEVTGVPVTAPTLQDVANTPTPAELQIIEDRMKNTNAIDLGYGPITQDRAREIVTQQVLAERQKTPSLQDLISSNSAQPVTNTSTKRSVGSYNYRGW